MHHINATISLWLRMHLRQACGPQWMAFADEPPRRVDHVLAAIPAPHLKLQTSIANRQQLMRLVAAVAMLTECCLAATEAIEGLRCVAALDEVTAFTLRTEA